jgi:hypothetical protein
MVLHWSMYRRPHGEYDRVKAATLDSHSNVDLRREIETMSNLAEKTWEEELKERFLSEGERRGQIVQAQSALRGTVQPQVAGLGCALGPGWTAAQGMCNP